MNTKKIKAIAVDIDGTITDSDRRICISAIEAIRAAEKIGIPTIIVTGNIFFYATATATLIGTTGGIVAENGGVISEIDSEGIEKIKVLGNFQKTAKAFEYLNSEVKNKYKDYELKKVDDSESRLSEIAIYRTIDEEILKNILKESPEEFSVEIYDTQFAIHITDINVNKGSSLETVAKKSGFHVNEIMAIGDSENDIEFLKVCGLKVAVANADKILKETADYVCKNEYGDGVKEAIEKFILKGN
ncbi:putative phosphoglycolate phosphatase [Methanobrevibacter arboriphilus JCM 13429 = DSM 1125]|uniref:Phosphoglycolate phosphatase n=2 Tax=Methanobrevibacter arboriphilus TaxID=39441 RepID=A0A1V6N203_METAZ|nr:phosphoglycolate phosphatase [Methanobrevibacter arboriphilus]OQD58674.1 putative phosphoglycolate phosphatase [Methanobrevibacter arboriphilus JCM 13429 = DSM 1125]